jgi:thioredoxin 1
MASDKITTLTDRTFDDATRQGVVLVDFWAQWCGPCLALAPTLEALATDLVGRATIAKLNVDEHPGIPARFNIRAIPTLLLFKDGEVAETIVGVLPKSQIARQVGKHL